MPRTVPTKVPFIQDILQQTNQLFIALTETWLRDHLNAELKIEGYSLFRSDRERQRRSKRGRDSGGVALYLRNDMAATAEPVLTFSNGSTEVLGVHIKSENLVIFVLYRQPDDSVNGHRSNSREFISALSSIKAVLDDFSAPAPEILLCGDFNLPHICWPAGNPGKRSTSEEKKMGHDLYEITQEYFLIQCIQEPTHKQGHILDLCFSNNPVMIHSYQCSETLFSDHLIIEARTSFSLNNESQSFRSSSDSAEDIPTHFNDLNFMSEDVDWCSLENELEMHEWKEELSTLSPTDMMKTFTQICLHAAQKHVPKRKLKHKNVSKIPRDRKILMRRRSTINKHLANKPSDARREKLQKESAEIERKLQASYKSERHAMEEKAVSAIKKNQKYFFTYARKFSKVATGIGPLIDTCGNIISCATRMASMLAEQYSSVFSKPREPLLDADRIFTTQDTTDNSLSDITFTEEDISKAIGELSPVSASGPDGFPSILLKNCKETLCYPLYLIWRKSLDEGVVPQMLKTANVIPIHKGGSRGVPKNYRPIALTSHLIKIFEKVLRSKIVQYMELHKLFNPNQHGFRFGRSCLSQLIAHYDTILSLLEQDVNVDVIYIDFAKAFDKVDFMVTLQKLKSLGITGKIGKWIHSFLTNRQQTVLVNEGVSKPVPVESGVPQGSVLGPLLFLILIGDIDQNVAHAFLSSFADDTRIGSKITTVDDVSRLQADLNTVYEWTSENNMQLNGDKFECMRYGRNNDIKETSNYKSNTDTIIQQKEHVKDLGVTMSNDGSFRQHIETTVLTAKKQCAWILRTFKSRDAAPLLTLWKSLVLCKLDYCSQLWSPTRKGEIQLLEMVQRSYIRNIASVRQMSYWEQLNYLRLYSLERRRERYMIIYIWKILEGFVPNISDLVGHDKISAKWHPRRGRECILPPISRRASSSVKQLREASLAVKGQKLFNILPPHIRNITGCTVESFKRRLDSFLGTVSDEPQIPGYTAQRRAESNSLLDMTCLASTHYAQTVEVPGDSLVAGSQGSSSAIASTEPEFEFFNLKNFKPKLRRFRKILKLKA